MAKKIYIIHEDAFDEKCFYDLTDEEIMNLDSMYVDVYPNLESLEGAWNCDEILYPSNSYMRVIDC